jgi:DNA anti-recombination protein RmuC
LTRQSGSHYERITNNLAAIGSSAQSIHQATQEVVRQSGSIQEQLQQSKGSLTQSETDLGRIIAIREQLSKLPA